MFAALQRSALLRLTYNNRLPFFPQFCLVQLLHLTGEKFRNEKRYITKNHPPHYDNDTSSCNLIYNNMLTINDLWTRVMAKVYVTSMGNSCWSYIDMEDKLGPLIILIVIQCIVMCFRMKLYHHINITTIVKIIPENQTE